MRLKLTCPSFLYDPYAIRRAYIQRLATEALSAIVLVTALFHAANS